MLDRRGGDLSGGQLQQLAIAIALIMKPKLFLLDEQTEDIQPNTISQIGEVISYLRGQQTMAIFLVEQCFDFAFELADRHGALVIPEDVIPTLKAAIETVIASEEIILGPVQQPGFDIQKLEEAWAKFGKSRT